MRACTPLGCRWAPLHWREQHRMPHGHGPQACRMPHATTPFTCRAISSAVLCAVSRSSPATRTDVVSWSVLCFTRYSLRLLSTSCCFPLPISSFFSPSLPPMTSPTRSAARRSWMRLRRARMRASLHAVGQWGATVAPAAGPAAAAAQCMHKVLPAPGGLRVEVVHGAGRGRRPAFLPLPLSSCTSCAVIYIRSSWHDPASPFALRRTAHAYTRRHTYTRRATCIPCLLAHGTHANAAGQLSTLPLAAAAAAGARAPAGCGSS